MEEAESREIFAIVIGGGFGVEPPNIPQVLQPLLAEFQEIILPELPDGLPHVRYSTPDRFNSRG